MKNRQTFYITAVLLISSVLFGAKLPNFYFTLGLGKIMSPEQTKSSYTVGTHLGVMAGLPITSKLEVLTDINFCLNTFNNREYLSTLPSENRIMSYYNIDGRSASIFSTMLKAKLLMTTDNNRKAVSYFFAGGGLFMINTSDTKWYYLDETQDDHDVVKGKSETVPGVTFGLGLEFKMESTVLMIEIGPTLGLTDEKTTLLLPFRLGVAIKN